MQRIGLDPVSQHLQSAPNVLLGSQGNSPYYYSKALDSNTHEESWLQAKPHGSLFCPLFLYPRLAQSSLVPSPGQHHRKMNPLGSASKEDYFSLTLRALNFCQPPQASFFSPGPYACFYLSKVHEFRTEIHKPCAVLHFCTVSL